MLPPKPSASQPPQARDDAGLSAEITSGTNDSGGGGGQVRPTPLYAEMRRVSTDVPCTSTLPDVIPLQQPGGLGLGLQQPVSVGRHRLNHVQLDCPRVPSLLSRQHAEITIDAHGVHFVTDKNTLNGTYLNGNLIPKGPCRLQHGDVVAFGGPANVLRDNKTLRNSFRYEYRQPLNLDLWKIQAATARRESVVGAGGVAQLASAAEDVEQCRPAKRARQTGDFSGGGGDGNSVPATTGGGDVNVFAFPTAATLISGDTTSPNGDARVQPQLTLPTQPQPSHPTLPTQITQPPPQPTLFEPMAEDDLPVKHLEGNHGVASSYRSPGSAVVTLSRRDAVSMLRVASKVAKLSPDFLRSALSELGKLLAETVVPLDTKDEVAFMNIIADTSVVELGTSNDVKLFSGLREVLTMNRAELHNSADLDMTQATEEYLTPSFSSNAHERLEICSFLTQVCQDSIELHVSPTGVASFGIKLLSVVSVRESETYRSKEMAQANNAGGASFKRGDLIAEAVALALWPLQQSGGEGLQGGISGTSKTCVFASSISEIDGHGSDIGAAGCRALAEGVLTPRKTADGLWIFNTCLRGLALGENPRLGDAGASALAAALRPRLCCNGTSMFNTSLTVLDLSSCGIGPEGATAIADALSMVANDRGDWRFPSNLRALRLSGNRIESKGARAIAGLLGPKENKKTGKWTFNPSLAVIDISDNFSGMNDLVAEAFAKALQPREIKSLKHNRDGEDVKQEYSTNVALLELHLCGHAFRNGVKTIHDALDPKYNGSDGEAGASVRVIFEHPGRDHAGEAKPVVDSEGHGYELILPMTTGCAAERRALSHWHWRPWNALLSPSRDDPSVAPSRDDPNVAPRRDDPNVAPETAPAVEVTAELPDWHKALMEDHHTTGSMLPWSVGFSLRNVLLQRLEGGDFILANQSTSVAAGLPQWLEDDLRCVICTDVFVNPYAVNGCGHTFCHDCISHWLCSRSNQCPICRHRLEVPTSVALTPCHMAQRLLDHYVLPYLPPKDVEGRRERAREVRNNAAERAAAARQAAAASEGGLPNSVAATAAAAIAMVTGAGGTASLRVTGVSSISALQQLIQIHTQRAMRHGQMRHEHEARTQAATHATRNTPHATLATREPPTQGQGSAPTPGRGTVPMPEAMALSLRSAQIVLENMREGRARGEEQLGIIQGPADPVDQPDWNAVSSSVETATPCRHCRTVIPPRFLRMKRTSVVSGVETHHYFHANYDCLRSVHHEIRAAPNIAVLPELSDQEKRVVSALRAVVANPGPIRRERLPIP